MGTHERKKVASTFFGEVKAFLSIWRCLFYLSLPTCPFLSPIIWPTSARHHQGMQFKPAAVCKIGGSKCLQVFCGNTEVVVLPPRAALASSLGSPFLTSPTASLDPLLILCNVTEWGVRRTAVLSRVLIDSRGKVLLKVHSWIIFRHIKVMAVSIPLCQEMEKAVSNWELNSDKNHDA